MRLGKVRRALSVVLSSVLLLSLMVIGGCAPASTASEASSQAVQSEISLTITGPTTLNAGETATYTLEASSDISDRTIKWTTDSLVATVDEKGVLTAVSEGMVTLYARLADKEGAQSSSAEFSVQILDPEAEKRRAEAKTKTSLKNTQSFTFTDTNGYKLKVTVKLSDWIKGSDTTMLNSAWTNTGGSGSMPLTTGNYSRGSYGGNYSFKDSKTAAYIVGTMTLENLTTDYPADNFGNGYQAFSVGVKSSSSSKTNWNTNSSTGPNIVMSIVKYSSKAEREVGSASVSADMTSNKWGPVAFVIAIDNVFTPNYPGGNPGFDGTTLEISSRVNAKTEDNKVMTPGKTW